MPRFPLVVAVVSLLLAAGVQSADAQVYLAPLIGVNGGGDAGSCERWKQQGPVIRDCTDQTITYGVAAGYLTRGVLGFEGEFGDAPQFFGRSAYLGENHVLTLMGSVLLMAPAPRVRPYLAAGAGLMRMTVEGAWHGLVGTTNGVGMTVGGGIIAFPASRVGVRVDARYVRSLNAFSSVEYDLFHQMRPQFVRLSVGLVLR